MNMRDLIPWTRSQDVLPEFFRDERSSPFLTLHREMNRLLEEAFRGFASTSLAGRRTDFVNPAWPKRESLMIGRFSVRSGRSRILFLLARHRWLRSR